MAGMRFALPLLSLLVLTGAAARLRVSDGLSGCGLYLCDDGYVAEHADELQAAGGSTPAVRDSLAGLLERDPANPLLWADLGSVYSQQAPATARYCFDRAVAIGGASTDVLVYAGDFYLEHGSRREAYRCFSRTLALSNEYDEAIFARYEGHDLPAAEVLQFGLPVDARAAQAYLRFLLRPETESRAALAWEWLLATSWPPGPRRTRTSSFSSSASSCSRQSGLGLRKPPARPASAVRNSPSMEVLSSARTPVRSAGD